ncbi:MAG: hypothetical protein JSR54_04220 [Proteobacteria bacterium]|nr:hypothetical protein [Pseudomonadota bacterium]
MSSAVALLCEQTAPLGLLMRARVMVIIFPSDVLLDTAWLWGALHTAILAALAWHFRSAFRPLWNHPGATADARRA